MTTKAAIISTGIVVLLCLAGGLAFLFTMTPQAAQRQAPQLGQGIGLVCGIACGFIWIGWALRRRRSRD